MLEDKVPREEWEEVSKCNDKEHLDDKDDNL